MSKIVSVVIPAKNEAAGIGKIVGAVFSRIADAGLIPQIIIVDDGSTDGTYSKAIEIASQTAGTRVLRLSRNFGKEPAIAAGLFAAEGSAAIVIDADFQHPVDVVPMMLTAWKDGYDIVETVKVRRAPETLLNRLSSQVFYFLFRFLTRFDISQTTDFKLIDRKVLDHWKQLHETHLFFRGMIAWLGFKKKQIPIETLERREGTSKWSNLHLLVYAMRSILSFSPFLLYVVSLATLTLSIITVFIGIRGIWVKMSGQVLDGLTIILLTQSIIGTALMLVMSAICGYLSLIFEELKKRPRFVIAETYPPFEKGTEKAEYATSGARC